MVAWVLGCFVNHGRLLVFSHWVGSSARGNAHHQHRTKACIHALLHVESAARGRSPRARSRRTQWEAHTEGQGGAQHHTAS